MVEATGQLTEAGSETLGSNIAGMFNFLIDPKAAATRLFTKWFWICPLAVLMAVSLAGSLIVTPIVQRVLETQPVPPGANPETYQAQIAMGMKIQRVFGIALPIVMLALQALVVWGMASVVAIEARFRQMLNLVAGCSLIQALAGIAGVIILRAKGDITTMAELRPALGLDIFLPEGTNKIVMAVAGCFSIFELWWIAMMVLVLSAAYRVGKAKAFTVVAPMVLISLAFRIVTAALQKS